MSSREDWRPCFFGVPSSVTACLQSVTQPVTELGTPKNMAANLPGMTLQPLYSMRPHVFFKTVPVHVFVFKADWSNPHLVFGVCHYNEILFLNCMLRDRYLYCLMMKMVMNAEQLSRVTTDKEREHMPRAQNLCLSSLIMQL